ncbi:toxin-antitoxin system YwqK family antitoxin [Intestinirhabdus alba]|jgi:antitoxin component YwqK of YwqJK toxin-antitoxin module|uniref:Toxin-antitoxin system YwqK family antitoxin n=1 Tax=Intestinirhabdus alba TaxID=2899544 RepID=A0A6L6IVI0_9ENTR|nr:toxin-antitoxin system YwqK family antitoxin [Intestinirhabdus alba]MTH48743.1 hypothetical protein [Intestinirhabdus alba]
MIFCKKIYIGLFSVCVFFPLPTFSASEGLRSDKFVDPERNRQVIITRYNAEQLEYFQEFSGGIPDGIYQSWWKNGQRKYKTFFVKGKENGVIHYWYKNGSKQFTGSVKDGVLDGELTSWYRNGNEWTKENYARGKKDGVWKSWYENQKLSSVLIFSSGEILKCSSWDSEGNRVYTGSEKKKCKSIHDEYYTMPMESEDPG